MPAVTALKGSFMLKMKRKTLFYTLFLPILLLTLSSIEIRAEGHEDVRISEQSDLRLAAWNIRIMSNKSRTDAELMKIARTLADYDFIAIVELRDEAVLKRTQRILLQMGTAYDYQFSPAVGRGVKERYAFLYKSRTRQCCQTRENSIRIRRMAKMISVEIRTGRPSVQASLIFQRLLCM